MNSDQQADTAAKSTAYREYDLAAARARPGSREPAVHQRVALEKLRKWYAAPKAQPSGGILALPTGAGKTFTAVRFLCTHPLSDGHKVLWLAHTHHLLDQAIDSLGPAPGSATDDVKLEVGHIAETRDKLRARLVSGALGHFQVRDIKTSDDVVFCTLQSAVHAIRSKHKAFLAFLESAEGKLFVVFDEAHHAPAPSYAALVDELRRNHPSMRLLGLTATPTYTDERRRGWLKTLFPQEIIHSVRADKLMADRILARPEVEQHATRFTPVFEERKLAQWISSYKDLPEDIIQELAKNQERNDFIVNTYVRDAKKYGKTIIFADRWHQCDYLREQLRMRGVRADVVYSHVDADPGSAEARNRRTSDDNASALKAFRLPDGKPGHLDVLINVRMLTEGTDVPKVQSVFLTRQTTSTVLLTQMVGRALRGAAFGGKDRAYIVSFIDNWKHAIHWAEYDKLEAGRADDDAPEYGKRPPLQLISIDLVRQLSRAMDSGQPSAPAPFTTLLPLGWYRVEFQAAIAETEGKLPDDTEWVRQLVMVFDRQKPSYERFIEFLLGEDLQKFASEDAKLDRLSASIEDWRARFFKDAEEPPGGSLAMDLFHIARHVAQGRGERPKFFSFEQRDDHDLDAIAQDHIDKDLGPAKIDASLGTEHNRDDRYWKWLYPRYELFCAQYQAVQRRLLDARRHGADPRTFRPVVSTPESVPVREPSTEVKQAVLGRDGKCLCCGATRRLTVDHRAPSYFGQDHSMDNLQTLCAICNRDKLINEVDFRVHRNAALKSPRPFTLLQAPTGEKVGSAEAWERYIRRTVNFYYQCAAVDTVKIGERGPSFYEWHIHLYPGNDPTWIKPHLPPLIERIQQAREESGLGALKSIKVTAAKE